MEMELLRVSTENTYSRVTAEYSNGGLRISAYDAGSEVEEFWGDEDYEYWFTFDRVNTTKLLEALRELYEEEDICSLLKHCFNGDVVLMQFCKKKGITYEFFSYV